MARREGESAATRNLRRTAAKTADALLRLVRQAIRDADKAVADALAKPTGLTEPGRAEANVQVDVLFRKTLKAKMEEALATLAGKAAENGNAEAIRQAEAAGETIPRFSEDYLRDYLARVSPANAPGLAAVFTQNLAAGQKSALRAAVVETFRSAAAAGLTTRERMKLLQENWARQAGDTQGARFVDRANRRWENARYVQMLARTTAQRVQTAAFCDSMLQGGFPLARISNDSGSKDCGVCAEWEGRLIDLTAKNEFRKFGAVPLRAAREAGVFHPNCTHRLEYLSPLEYPKGAYEAFAGRVGEPGAFGDPLKTNALNETAASAKKRAAEAAQAAAEAAKRKAEEEAAAKDALELIKSLVPHAVDALTGEAAARTAQAQSAAQDAAGTLAANAVKTVTAALDKEWEGFTAALDAPETLGKRLGGSTGARLVELLGRKFVLKGGATPEHLASEQAADEAYRAAGLNVPAQRTVVSKSGKRFKLADFTEGQDLAAWWNAKGRTKAERDAMRAKLQAGLDVDAMLGNWDVIGMSGDNILVDKDGEPWRIDNGGSLGFRAQGARKADADWKDGWPNELFTIAGSTNNAPYVGGTSSLTLIRQAAKRDWQKVIDALPDQADKDALAKRVAEMRQLAARTDDFDRGGYDDAFTARVIEHSFNLSKEGFREEVPKTVTYGNYGFCRTAAGAAHKPKAQSAPAAPGAPKPVTAADFADIPQLALAAIKTVQTHAQDGNYNLATLNAFLDKKHALTELIKLNPKNKGALHYASVMATVENAYQNKKPIAATLDTSVIITPSKKALQAFQAQAKVAQQQQATQPQPAPAPAPTAAKPAYTSLTDHIAQYMAAHGADYGFIQKWCESQAGDSWTGRGGLPTCRRKIVQLAARGLNWDPPPPSPGVYYGTGKASQKRAYADAVAFYKKNPAQLDKDIEAVAQYKAAVQLLMENANFQGNDRTKREIILFRTEDETVVGRNLNKGDICKHSVGPTESHSIFKAYCFNGHEGTIVRVPYSRINAAYFMERTPGKADELFLGDNENEFNADTIGLTKTYTGKTFSGEQVSKYYSLAK